MSNSNTDAFAAILDPKFLKTRLVHVAIFVMAFELLKSAIIDRIRDFFIDGYDGKEFRVSDRYKESLVNTGKKHLSDQSLQWLVGMNAINEEDVKTFHSIRTYRNELVHKLPEMVSKLDVEREASLLREAANLLRKIEVWWVKNVELATDPDYDGTEVRDEDIVPGTLMFLQVIAEVGLKEGEEAEMYLREFQKRQKSTL